MTGYYDRQGRPLSSQEWGRRLADYEYKKVEVTEVGAYTVSTVWIGLNMRHFGEGAPIIFETMVFSSSEWNDPEHFGLQNIDCQRYCTEDEARTGHREMVELIRATTQTELGETDVARRGEG